MSKNEYKPWKEMGITEVDYFKKRYLEIMEFLVLLKHKIQFGIGSAIGNSNYGTAMEHVDGILGAMDMFLNSEEENI